MGETTKISWTDHTFNPWVGCAKVSEGCKHCYAEHGTTARVSRSRGLPLWGVDAGRQVTSDTNWRLPLRWDRAARLEGVRRRVFCASLADVFEDRPNPKPGFHYVDVLREARARLWKLIAETPHLDWLLLTKRPENADRLALQAWSDAWAYSTAGGEPEGWWLPNIWLGTTCENQARANERIPHLLEVPAAVRFVSYEPALELVDFTRFLPPVAPMGDWSALHERRPMTRFIDWIIVGGESGPEARPFDVQWGMETIRDCRRAGVAVFFKQAGRVAFDSLQPDRHDDPHPEGPAHDLSCRLDLRDPKGGDLEELDEDLHVREWPR